MPGLSQALCFSISSLCAARADQKRMSSVSLDNSITSRPAAHLASASVFSLRDPLLSGRSDPPAASRGGSSSNNPSNATPISSSAVSFACQNQQRTYLMPSSSPLGRRSSVDYRPSIRKAQGQIPACLVNASLTYCGNDQIYAFGGFDQFTDEGELC